MRYPPLPPSGNSRLDTIQPIPPSAPERRLAPSVLLVEQDLLYFFRIVKEQPITLVQETRSKQRKCRLLMDSGTADTTSKPALDWWSWTGSNRRPPACKAGALPTELQPRQTLVGLDGFEPSTPALSRRCSNQLSYRPLSGHRGRETGNGRRRGNPRCCAMPRNSVSCHLATTDKSEHWNARAFRERR